MILSKKYVLIMSMCTCIYNVIYNIIVHIDKMEERFHETVLTL